jgi:hypothetical protein
MGWVGGEDDDGRVPPVPCGEIGDELSSGVNLILRNGDGRSMIPNGSTAMCSSPSALGHPA